MAVTIIDGTGPLITAKITGELSKPEVTQVQSAAVEAIGRCGTISALLILENFHGWKRGGDWGDVSFMTLHDEHVSRIAVVGEEKWRDLVYAFLAKGFRHAAIEYFLPAELAKARAWLSAGTH
jgi:SpoIIAA-like